MKNRGRPTLRQVELRDGFYIEVCNKGMSKGVKIRSENQAAMEDAAERYAKGKHVIILGEYKGGSPVKVKSFS